MNIYLIASESYKLLNDEVEKIASSFSNIIKYDLRKNTIEEVINECGYYSLLPEKKLIIVRATNLFKSSKKEETSDSNKNIELENYLKNSNPDVTLVFTSSEGIDKRKKIYKLIEQNGKVINIETLNKKDLCYKCIDLLKGKGYKIDYEIANFIVENSYVNYDILLNELEKIYKLLKPGIITKNDLNGIISNSLNASAFDYISAVINRDLEKALNSSKNFELLKIDPSMVLIMLYKEFQILYLIKNKENSNEIAKIFRKEPWQMKKYLEYDSIYTLNEIKNIIILLGEYDYKLKSGQVDKSVLLDLISLEFCE